MLGGRFTIDCLEIVCNTQLNKCAAPEKQCTNNSWHTQYTKCGPGTSTCRAEGEMDKQSPRKKQKTDRLNMSVLI